VRLSRLGRLQRRDRYHAFYHEGARPDGLFVLLSGAVRLQAGGDETGRDLKPPCVFGLESLAALGETALGIRPVERLEAATSILPSVVVHVPGEGIAPSDGL
jgi:CRP-like cAMP-binding protein